jgi:formylglycine-generating enzyme required for sulfatase activity
MSETAIHPILQAGGTLRPGTVYIERPEDAELLRLLRDRQYVNVLSGRQMGKSSLMVRTIQKLQHDGIRTAAIDVAAELVGASNSETWFRGLLNRIRRDLNLSFDIGAFWASHPDDTASQKLQRFFRDVVSTATSGPIVIFLDEIENTLNFDFTDALFTCLRGMYNERALVPAYERVTFCLLGVATPNELIKDRRTTAYNVGTTLELRSFDSTVDDFEPLFRVLSDNRPIAAVLLDRVLYWTGGQPFLTIRLCADLQREGPTTPALVDQYIERTFSSLDRVSGDIHFLQILRFVQTRFSGGVDTLDVYARLLDGERIKELPTPVHLELKLSGLVKRDADGYLILYGPIYARLFNRAWLDTVLSKERLAVATEAVRPYRLRLAVTRALVGVLVAALGVGVVAWWYQERLREYMYWATDVRLQLLTPEQERALKPKDVFKECTGCPEMIVVPAGEFMMGSPATEKARYDDEGPEHEVTIGRPFAVGRLELTFDEWDACVAHGDCDADISDSGWGRGRQPATFVNWNDAKTYVAWLSRVTGKPYRLLSEAEWEYAARAGSQTAYPWGDEIGKGNANCDGCGSQWDHKQAAPVGQFPANAFGLHDMRGNVWEWVEDCYHQNYNQAPMDGSPWTTGDCIERVVRGGSWLNFPGNLRSASRGRYTPSSRNNFLGFRVGRTLLPP